MCIVFSHPHEKQVKLVRRPIVYHQFEKPLPPFGDMGPKIGEKKRAPEHACLKCGGELSQSCAQIQIYANEIVPGGYHLIILSLQQSNELIFRTELSIANLPHWML